MVDLQRLIGMIRQEVRTVVDPLFLQERSRVFTSAGVDGVLRTEFIPTDYVRTIAQEEVHQAVVFYTQQALPQGMCVVTTGDTVTQNGKQIPVVAPVDITNPNHSKQVVGVVMQTASENSPVRILKKGVLTYEDGSTFVSGNVVFIGVNGKLTTTPPSSGAFIACMGHAITTTTVFVEYRYVITLS